MIFDRTPLGKFCDRGSLMHHWLPLFLRWGYGNRLTEMLSVAAKECLTQSAKHHRMQADEIEQHDWNENARDWQIRQAAKWELRRRVLIEAHAKLKEID